MDYKNERDDINSSNQYYMLLKKYKEENEFSFYSYLNILDAAVNGGHEDIIYDCIDELIGNLNQIETIDPPYKDDDRKKILIFFRLIDNDELDIQILSTLCMSLVISKCNEIGILLYKYNIVNVIYEKIKNKGKSPMIYRFFDIICSLSLIDQEILNSILEFLPISLWINFLRIDAYRDKFIPFLITSFENADISYQKNIFTIFSEIIEEKQEFMFETISESINQMMDYSKFDFDLFFNYDFRTFILHLLSSNDKKLTILSLQLISKSIHALFFIDSNHVNTILHFAQQVDDIQIKYLSLLCLSEIVKVNHDFALKFILKEDFLKNLSKYAETTDYKVKICIINFLLESLSISNYQLCFSLIINDDIFECFSFLLSCDEQNVLQKFLVTILNMAHFFQINNEFKSFKQKLNTQLPLELFLQIRDNLDPKSIVIYDQLITTLFNENLEPL
ncbi:hypothetical protein M9Y10_041176 [Tritrichomonas musculus]|uniref:Uncharacterized protein n=1 Tax=Tritrichomonas musculus TaxID=1915356 RepID=A0ABR2K3Q6_9EUKA